VLNRASSRADLFTRAPIYAVVENSIERGALTNQYRFRDNIGRRLLIAGRFRVLG